MMTLGLLILASSVCYASALPPCVCGRIYLPVCGSDGVTYSNECRLACERSKGNTELQVAKKGRCESDKEPAERVCICTMDYRPVCGTDGETYGNQCALECEMAKTPKLEKKSDGACPGANDVEPTDVPERNVCDCTRNMRPVCGSDGVSYNNECLLKCAAAQQKKEITVAREGRCEFDEDACECTRELIPVCGKDGVTYSNRCLMKCAGAEEASKGQC